jgi:hypothetical protein
VSEDELENETELSQNEPETGTRSASSTRESITDVSALFFFVLVAE